MKRRSAPRSVSFAETGEAIKQNFLVRARNGLFDTPYPGYPAVRYVGTDPTETVIPEGDWTLHNTHAKALSDKQTAELKSSGIEFNEAGAPIHPWLSDMIADPDIGVVGGPGAYWNQGPNKCSDNIPISRLFRRVLLIKRGDTGSWALAGGFRNDNTEEPFVAARRELIEETRLSRYVRILSKPVLIYAGIVADKRTTGISWAHTHAIVTRPLLPWPHVRGRDDATKAKWFKLDKLPDDFFGSHSILVDLAKDVIDGKVTAG
jgi:ADP-ribose pyrophosphatase YjhB (NUDIX family)